MCTREATMTHIVVAAAVIAVNIKGAELEVHAVTLVPGVRPGTDVGASVGIHRPRMHTLATNRLYSHKILACMMHTTIAGIPITKEVLGATLKIRVCGGSIALFQNVNQLFDECMSF
ncbi:uncharacterized protein LOC123562941 [Mercenaria mercenaria]|uniref:uncharacterized protein LOC123562941 n=1 Tax=Mercenaria mercenaria TaxID=6596 RepID=UPI00234F5589|nr:uncharacterized protein LOC123562941 [Mercenaria mercenaria]